MGCTLGERPGLGAVTNETLDSALVAKASEKKKKPQSIKNCKVGHREWCV